MIAKYGLHTLARTIMRPQARQYDEQEHERPYPFIHAIWPLERARHQQLQAYAAQEATDDEPDLDVLFSILLAERLSWGDAGQFLARPGGRLGGTAVIAAGTPTQKATFLERFAHSDAPVWGAMAITEPDAGSDNSAMRTTAVLDPDTNEWILNGQKIFITSGALSLVESDGLCIVWATVAGIELDYTKPRHLQTAVERDLLEMEAQYKAAWLLTLKATAAIMHGRSNRLDASMCKVKAGTAVVFVTQKAVELLGPFGYTRAALVEKLMRDAKINDLYEGTRQINLLIVARALLGYSRRELK
ncbi:MAG: acyl-CoA dehydrogenase [Anaerolineae bacterium]|nr:acyl-CoA dehydrogenase [Anaerolineae bacterium]